MEQKDINLKDIKEAIEKAPKEVIEKAIQEQLKKDEESLLNKPEQIKIVDENRWKQYTKSLTR